MILDQVQALVLKDQDHLLLQSTSELILNNKAIKVHQLSQAQCFKVIPWGQEVIRLKPHLDKLLKQDQELSQPLSQLQVIHL